MDVISAEIKLVFCEGEPNSLDYALLNHILPPHANIHIEPASGKGGLSRFAEGYFRQIQKDDLFANQPKANYVIFRDRDFDAIPPDQVQLIRQERFGSRVLLSHPTCIENYFLDGDLFHQFWDYRSQNTPNWRSGPSLGTHYYEDQLEKAAKSISDYQAVRWALTAMKPEEDGFGLKNYLTNKKDDLPTSLDKESCVREAQKLLNDFNSRSHPIDLNQFHDRLNGFLETFRDKGFWDNRRYKIYFSGKDLTTQMQKQSSKLPSFKDYHHNWAVEHFDWQKHPDLIELAKEMETP